MVALAKYCGASLSDLDQMGVDDLTDWLHWAGQHAAMEKKALQREEE